MNLQIIKNDQQYEQYLNWIDEKFDNGVELNSEDGEKVQIALLLIKQYEDEHYPIPLPDPIEVIKMKMEERGLKNTCGPDGNRTHI